MKDNYGKKVTSMIDPETNEVVYFVGNIQVEYYMLMEKINTDSIDVINMYVPSRGFVGATTHFFGKVKDIFENISYSFCRVDSDTSVKFIRYNNKDKRVSDKFVAIPFKTYLREFLTPEQLKEKYGVDATEPNAIEKIVNKELKETIDRENGIQRKRTTK